MTQDNIEVKKKEFANEIIIPEIIAMLNSGHSVTLGLRGYSMRPFLEDRRDKALLRKPTAITVGDVVLAEISPKRYVLHRIISINGDNITLRGDGIAEGFYRKGRNKLDSTSSRKWKVYSMIWTRLLPIRRYLLFAYRKLWRL